MYSTFYIEGVEGKIGGIDYVDTGNNLTGSFLFAREKCEEYAEDKEFECDIDKFIIHNDRSHKSMVAFGTLDQMCELFKENLMSARLEKDSNGYYQSITSVLSSDDLKHYKKVFKDDFKDTPMKTLFEFHEDDDDTKKEDNAQNLLSLR